MGNINKLQMQAVQNTKPSSEVYYDSDSGFKYYSIINSIDYSGMGIFPELVTETEPATGKQYPRGEGLSIRDATIKRDEKMLALIVENIPKDKKVKVLELGSGRGGLSRYICQELLKLNKLELLIAANISDKENDYNRSMAK